MVFKQHIWRVYLPAPKKIYEKDRIIAMNDKEFTKVKYSNEGKNIELAGRIICGVITILLILNTIFLPWTPNGIIIKSATIIIAVLFMAFMLRLSKKVALENNEVRRRRKEIVELGDMCEGKIIALNKRRFYSTTKERLDESYYLTAEYFSAKSGCVKRVDSSCLARTPNGVVGNDCIVYEYDGEAIIDSVAQMSDKKMSPLDIVMLIVVIALFGVAIYFSVKN